MAIKLAALFYSNQYSKFLVPHGTNPAAMAGLALWVVRRMPGRVVADSRNVPGMQKLAELCNTSRRSVRRAIDRAQPYIAAIVGGLDIVPELEGMELGIFNVLAAPLPL